MSNPVPFLSMLTASLPACVVHVRLRLLPVQFGAVGDVFAPHIHEALYEFEDESKEAGSIGQLVKDGYMYNDRVLRPAQAGTVRGTP